MKEDKIIWQYIFRIFNKRYWNGELKDIPVFKESLRDNKVGEFLFTEEGFNSILLASNEGLSNREMMGVLLHEMCHASALKQYGCNIEGHGLEWQNEMKKVGFSGLINELTDGIDFFSEEDENKILEEYLKMVNEYEL